jgi:selenocysteine-specific elongation factor
MYVIGTAGHVDHGKSTLVKTLTGIDPDRWAEEQRREMTIDLGFAWLTLPSGRSISVIDVPGHERFIKNMLAGVGGLDAALLIIAADESIMPQTSEHVAILDLLGIDRGIVVLTKADLVDEEWLSLVREEVSGRLRDTSFAAAPVLAVSARSGYGLDDLRRSLDTVLDSIPSRGIANGAARLPIDRAFTVGGFGTVVTGTLADGPLSLGQELVVLPQGLVGRVRGLQTHQTKAEHVRPGMRVAVNLAGVHHRAITRGDVLTVPGAHTPTSMLDVDLRIVADAAAALEQNTALDLFIGATEVPCRVTLLNDEQLAPGTRGWAQLRLERPIVAARSDRFIVRQPSPSRTVGGGLVIDPHPARHRRFRAEVVTSLQTLARGAPDELLLNALGETPQLWAELLHTSGLGETTARSALAILLSDGRALDLGDDVYLSAAAWAKIVPRIAPPLSAYHRRFPLRSGMSREELRQRLKLSATSLGPLLREAERRGIVALTETTVRLPDFIARPNAAEQGALDDLLAAIARTPYSPPPPELDNELLAWALEQNVLVRVSADVAYLPHIYAELLDWVRATITEHGSVSVGQFRDRFGSSRKYALAFLEHLDERKITRRAGDGRVLF